VEITDGTSIRVNYAGDRPVVKVDDPVFGPNGSEAGAAFLRDFSRIRAAMDEAVRAGDGLFRVVGLGPGSADGMVLAGADAGVAKVVLIPPGHRWNERLQRALGVDNSSTGPLVRYAGDAEPRHVGKNSIKPEEGGKARTASLTALFNENPRDVYASPRLDAQVFGGKAVPRSPPSHDVTVKVRKFRVQQGSTGESVFARPDIYRFDGKEWVRIVPAEESAGPGGQGGGGGAGPGPAPGGAGLLVGAVTATILLVCADDETNHNCDDG
jgi:hypothetical protein